MLDQLGWDDGLVALVGSLQSLRTLWSRLALGHLRLELLEVVPDAGWLLPRHPVGEVGDHRVWASQELLHLASVGVFDEELAWLEVVDDLQHLVQERQA